MPETKMRDARKDEYYTGNGYIVMHFTNDEVNEEIKNIKMKIEE